MRVGVGVRVAVGVGENVGIGVLVAVRVGSRVGVKVGSSVGVRVRVGVTVAVGVKLGVGVLGSSSHIVVVIVSVSVETVPPKARAFPFHVTVLPIVIPEASISVPRKVELAPSVVAAPGAHQTVHALAPFEGITIEPDEVFKVPVILKI